MIHKIVYENEDFKSLLSAIAITGLLFYTLVFVSQVRAATQTTTLSVVVNTSFTFAITNNAGTTAFTALDPGTFRIATTTLSVTTNDVNGWTVALAGDDQSPTDTVMDLSTDASVGITDQTEWVPGAATTSVGNAVVRASLDNTGQVLAFRVMSASSTNGTAFLAPTWWGATDVDGVAKWAGIASSTVSRLIGSAGAGSYSATAHLNTVQYYLDVPASQQTGTYTGALTYTGVGL